MEYLETSSKESMKTDFEEVLHMFEEDVEKLTESTAEEVEDVSEEAPEPCEKKAASLAFRSETLQEMVMAKTKVIAKDYLLDTSTGVEARKQEVIAKTKLLAEALKSLDATNRDSVESD